MSDHMQRPVCYRDLKTSTQNYIHRVWQETWDKHILNKLHNVHPSTSHWAALPVRRHDVRLNRLRIGHTGFTHRHLLLVAQYVDEHYPVDKWHLGDLIAWVAQSALKYRPRICELSKCLEGPKKDDRVSQEIAPHTVTPCEIAVCRSTINAGSDRWPVRLQTRVRWSSALRLNRNSSLKMTRLQSVTLQVARGRQNPVDTAYDVGSVAGGIIGPYFFKTDEGHNVTVNGDRYRAMTTNFFIHELNNHDVQELWFQQDGATCHTTRATIDLLKDTFVDRLVSRFGPVNRPPRSCDLTPLDYFLWGYVKSLVYVNKPQTLDPLEDNIRRVIADIRPQMLEKVIENWTSRLDYIGASHGSHMPEIIFKM
ncbi:putative transposable element [Trichonephila clavipes]|nr:putative transposable element [Trichonephila clavipes]